MIEKKTAVLIAASTFLGASLTDASSERLDHYYAYGWNLGLAYQLQDDLLGIWGDPAVTGKSAASDLEQRKKSLPVVFGLEHSPGFAARYAQPHRPGQPVAALADELEQVGAREYVAQRVRETTACAEQELERCEASGPAAPALRELTQQLIASQSIGPSGVPARQIRETHGCPAGGRRASAAGDPQSHSTRPSAISRFEPPRVARLQALAIARLKILPATPSPTRRSPSIIVSSMAVSHASPRVVSTVAAENGNGARAGRRWPAPDPDARYRRPAPARWNNASPRRSHAPRRRTPDRAGCASIAGCGGRRN